MTKTIHRVVTGVFTAISLLATAGAVSHAFADTIFTDQAAFAAAITGAATDGFSTSSSPFVDYGSAYAGATFTVTNTSNLYTVDPSYYAPYYDWNSGAVLDAENGLLLISANSANAIGFNFGNPSSFDPTGFVTIDGMNYGSYSQPSFGFFGVIASSPVTVSIDFNGGLGILDYVTTGVGAVPEPSSWAMIILGFCGVGFMACRRQPKPATGRWVRKWLDVSGFSIVEM